LAQPANPAQPVHASPVAQPFDPPTEPGVLIPSLSWRFWLFWLLSSTVGYTLGFGGMQLLMRFWSSSESLWIFAAAMGTLVGVCVGGLQWLLLRKQLRRSALWILATALGFTLANLVFLRMTQQPAAEALQTVMVLGSPLLGGVAGVLLGVLQWLVMVKQVRYAAGWILVSAVDLGLAALGISLLSQGWSGSALGLLLLSLACHCRPLTGLALLGLLRQPCENL
jgi:hypothetical protein